jgi:WD40 repeat protein
MFPAFRPGRCGHRLVGCLALAGWLLAKTAAAQPGLPDEIDPPGGAKPVLALDTGGHTNAIYKLLPYPYAEQLISVGLDKTIRFWDVATGESVRVLRPPIGPGSHGYLFAAALSPDCRYLAVGGYRAQTPLYDHRIHLIALPEGQIVHSLKGHAYAIYDLAFSADSKQLASASHDGTVKIWDAASGTLTRTLQGHTNIVHGVAWSPDGQRIVSGSFDKTARIWNAATGAEIAVMHDAQGLLNAVGWSPDGRSVATGGTDRIIRLYEPSGKLRYAWPKLPNEIMSLAFGPDSMRLAYTFGSNSQPPIGAAILELKDGRESVRYTGHSNSPLCCAWLRDGAQLVTGDSVSNLRVWDAKTGATARQLDSRGKAMISAGWSPCGQAISWGHSIQNATIDGGGPLERTFCLRRLDFGPPPKPDFSRAKKQLGDLKIGLLVQGAQTQSRRVGIATSAGVQSQFGLPQQYDQVRCYSLLADGRAAVGGNFCAYLFDIRTGLPQHELNDRGAEVWGLAPSADSRYLLTASNDQILRAWSVESGELLLSFFEAGSEWIAWTPGGYYAASFAGENLMGWHLNRGPNQMAEYFSAARFHKSLYRPDIIRLVLEVGDVARSREVADRERAVESRTLHIKDVLPPKVTITAPNDHRTEVNDPITIEATAQPTADEPITSMRLVIDGRPWGAAVPIDSGAGKNAGPAPSDEAATAPSGQPSHAWTVDLPSGEHSVAVKAETAHSYGLSPPVEIVRRNDASAAPTPESPAAESSKPLPPSGPAGTTGDLYVLSIGVSPTTQGSIASTDAESAKAVAGALEKAGRGRYGATQVRTLADRDATAPAIESQLSAIRGQMQPADTAVIYYSGEATADANGDLRLGAARPTTAPAPRGASVQTDETGYSSRQLKESLGGMPGRVVLMLDARRSTRERSERKTAISFCGVAEEESGDKFDVALADLLRTLLTEDYGVVVFSAGRDERTGAATAGARPFAQAVGEGLGGKADADHDGVIQTGELGPYVTRRAKELTSGAATPTVERPSGARSFPLGNANPASAPAK